METKEKKEAYCSTKKHIVGVNIIWGKLTTKLDLKLYQNCTQKIDPKSGSGPKIGPFWSNCTPSFSVGQHFKFIFLLFLNTSLAITNGKYFFAKNVDKKGRFHPVELKNRRNRKFFRKIIFYVLLEWERRKVN